MLELWTWPTSNGHKIHIMVEELGIPYKVMPVDISIGEQFQPEFLSINPNNRVPAIVDHDGPGGKPLKLFESGAILIYLADKYGKFIPTDAAERYTCLQWLMFQMSAIGPMTGQYNHFHHTAKEQWEYSKERYANEVARLYRVLDKRLTQSEYLVGPDYSIADIATFPWLRHPDRRGLSFDMFPGIKRWFETIETRPGVQRGFKVIGDHPPQITLTDAQRDVMFGKMQFTPR